MWVDGNDPSKAIPSDQKSVPVLLSQINIPNHVRQAALAARKLGEGVFDGMDAVTSGLAKRGVVQTYVMIEGCAKELGCTAIVRVRCSCNKFCIPSAGIFHMICLFLFTLFRVGSISTSIENGEKSSPVLDQCSVQYETGDKLFSRTML